MSEAMNVARKAAERAARQAGRAASWAGIPGTPLVAAGLMGMLAAAVACALGWFLAGGIILAAGAVAAFGGRSAGSAAGWPSRWTDYACTVSDRVGDAPVIAGIAWWLRSGVPREAVVAVAAVSLVFLSAYATVRGLSLGYPAPGAIVGAPERSAVVAAGLVVPHLSEPALWAVCAIGAASFLRSAATVWRQSAA